MMIFAMLPSSPYEFITPPKMEAFGQVPCSVCPRLPLAAGYFVRPAHSDTKNGMR